jgi:hypothetical protein
MPLRIFDRSRIAFAIGGFIACGFALVAEAQGLPAKTDVKPQREVPTNPASTRVFEDDEIRLLIPTGWVTSRGEHPVFPYGTANHDHTLVLAKGTYVLALEYDTSHASGVDGGRFFEALDIPWMPDYDQAVLCFGTFAHFPQPASRALMFVNFALDTSDPKVRETCAIQGNPGTVDRQGSEGGQTLRWFAGYFTDAAQRLFLDSPGMVCRSKLYVLSVNANTPDQFPLWSDARLGKIIDEAIDIVDSIHYKRCPPEGMTETLH